MRKRRRKQNDRPGYVSGHRALVSARAIDPYGKARDDSLDFPDDPQAEPTTDEIRASIDWGNDPRLDESAGLRGAQR